MEIRLNGEARPLPGRQSVAALLEQLELGGRRVAVERNGEIVPASRYGDEMLEPDDRIEIVHAIGGG
ncbi:MAG: sulfur carrier protein ThiS [Wenzhouxiangellaceae bacterium]|nr:sulfur carrier protein ThiS [Wenzhouxiangellaceae bacterium]